MFFCGIAQSEEPSAVTGLVAGSTPAPTEKQPLDALTSQAGVCDTASMSDKYCPRCNQTLPASDFNRNNTRSDGLSSYCRKCNKSCRGARVGQTKTCPDCGVSFFANTRRQKVCSRSCKQRKRIQTGDKNPNWKGVHISTRGYAYVCLPHHPRAMKNGYVKRADLVAEIALGRSLLPSEIVHHKNHDKIDDRPENLQVLTKQEHSRLHGLENAHHLKKKK